jgi:hypothetical protein
MGFEAGTAKMLNEYRTRLHVNASEYVHVMTSAMWDSIARIKSIHHSTKGIPVARDVPEEGQVRQCQETNCTVSAYSKNRLAP